MAPVTAPVPGEKLFDNFFGRMAILADPYTEAHPVGTMASFMAIYSAFIGNGPRITTRGRAMPLAFWPILCGLSGKGRKGTATNLALEIAEGAIPSFTGGNIQYGFDSGLGLIQELHSRIGGENRYGPEPIVVIEEELSKLQEQAKKDRRLGTTLTKLWDGATIQYKTGKDHLEVPHPHAAFIGHVQPKLFHATRGSRDAAGGTWNRFLIFWVERSKSVNIFGDMPGYDRAVAQMASDFRRAAHFGCDVPRVRVPDKVAKTFEKHHRPLIEALTSTSEEISEFAERAMAYTLRVAALYALADGEEWVQVRHFDSALDLIRYSIHSLQYILSSNRTFNGRSTLAQKVLAFVRQHGPCTFTKMRTHLGMATTPDVYKAAIRELEGEVVTYKVPRKPGQRGIIGLMVALAEDPTIPADAVFEDTDDEDLDEADPTTHPNYTAETTITVEVVDAEPVDEPKSPREPLKELPPPRPAKSARRTSQVGGEPHKATQPPPLRKEGHKVAKRRPVKVPKDESVADPASWI